MGLFWRKGYGATSLQDLVGAMGLSRSSFYQAFGSKHQLFLTCLERYEEATALDLITRLDGATTGREFIEDTLLWAIEEVIEGADPKGCLVVNTANELVVLPLRIPRRAFAKAIVISINARFMRLPRSTHPLPARLRRCGQRRDAEFACHNVR